ncbi:hypothetical protein Glove_132g41 [Diversispora epigaea]|uniref:Uncharacterized protein n=1 Tax=Diversispora epigaea TaxID=1348612 RepID=A0A397J0E0_9GLOM|nr:hypothetical protein Glove_132g41 [Diversispora epigaea]
MVMESNPMDSIEEGNELLEKISKVCSPHLTTFSFLIMIVLKYCGEGRLKKLYLCIIEMEDKLDDYDFLDFEGEDALIREFYDIDSDYTDEGEDEDYDVMKGRRGRGRGRRIL